MKEGGGADALVPFARTRVSRVNIAQQILEAHMQPMDEQLLVGESNLAVAAWRLLPITDCANAVKWATILLSMALNIAFPDRRCYYTNA
eukprot:9454-Heterococcus_DN1.PRE.1